jgi:FkbM family methyltransferase
LAVVGTIAVIALLFLIRGAGRRIRLAEQKTVEQQQQIEAQSRTADQQARQIEAQSRTAGEQTRQIESQASQIDLQARKIEVLERRSSELEIQLAGESSRTEALTAQVLEMSGKIAELSNSVEILRRLPPRMPPMDAELLEKMAEPEMIALAESMPTLRPLVPYPNWRFDIEWTNPDLAFQARRQIWQSFHDRRIDQPVTINWHLGTRLRLGLRNDLSRQIYVAGCIDPNEFAFLNHYLQPGMTFVDMGANEGVYTVFAARRVGQSGSVWAFEPSQREYDSLRANLDLNGLIGPNVRLFPLAIADFNGYTELAVAATEHAGQNTMGAFASAGIGAAGTQTIEVRRLDDLIAEDAPARIDFIKLDVEGAELKAIHGAAGTLRRYRPVLLFEVSAASLRPQGASREGLVAFLRSLDYLLYVFDDSGLPAVAEPGAYGDNMLAVPAGTVLPSIVFQGWPVN